MCDQDRHHFILLSWILIGGCTIARIFYAQSFLLTPDETNYWQWSRYLAWAYHDQTPMIAWTIRFFTALFGQTELAVRLPSILSLTVASLFLVKMARHWFSDRVAWQTAIMSQSVFIFNAGALLATADGLQGAAWAGACYHVARGFENNQWRQWLAGGIWFGFGMLSKYSMVLFLPFVFFFGLILPSCRKRLAGFRPYIGCLLGVLMFVPVIAWNAGNHWNSFRHVAYLGGANEGFTLHWKYLGEYIGSQILIVTPMAFGVILASWIWVIRRRRAVDDWIYFFLFATSLPMIAGFALLSLHARVYANWPCAGYLTGCILAAALWSGVQKPRSGSGTGVQTRRLWRWTWSSALVLTAVVLIHVHWPFLPIPPTEDRTIYELRGWNKLGAEVARAQASMPRPHDTFVFGLRYQIASELAFYMPGKPYTVSINRWNRPNVYDYWWQDDQLLGKDAVGVTRDKSSRDRLLEVFDQVDAAEPFYVFAPGSDKAERQNPSPVTTLYVFRCYGFKGGLRWIPPHRGDIRVSSDATRSAPAPSTRPVYASIH